MIDPKHSVKVIQITHNASNDQMQIESFTESFSGSERDYSNNSLSEIKSNLQLVVDALITSIRSLEERNLINAPEVISNLVSQIQDGYVSNDKVHLLKAGIFYQKEKPQPA